MPHVYETDGAAIYRQSFATIRSEADLARFTPDEEPVVVRMIHAAGMVGLEAHVRFTSGMAARARAALQEGAPILCDARMVSEGITRARLPAGNAVICTLGDVKGTCACAIDTQHALRGSARAVAAASGRCHRRDRQCADGAVPSAQHAGGSGLPTAGGDHRLSGRLCRRGGIQGGIDG
ncbi:precorrin isomerase [Bradyrhizobium sp. USDA 4520]